MQIKSIRYQYDIKRYLAFFDIDTDNVTSSCKSFLWCYHYTLKTLFMSVNTKQKTPGPSKRITVFWYVLQAQYNRIYANGKIIGCTWFFQRTYRCLASIADAFPWFCFTRREESSFSWVQGLFTSLLKRPVTNSNRIWRGPLKGDGLLQQ